MKYFKVRWLHQNLDEPVWLYSELDDDGWEIRKVEIFADGNQGFASPSESKGSTALGIVPVPPLEVILRDSEFEGTEITKQEFEEAWTKRNEVKP
jgi:hypothetical protein